MRGSRAARTLLKFALAMEKDAQQMGFRWLKVLNDSKRSWPPNQSVNLRFLNSPILSARSPEGVQRQDLPGTNANFSLQSPTDGALNWDSCFARIPDGETLLRCFFDRCRAGTRGSVIAGQATGGDSTSTAANRQYRHTVRYESSH